MKRKSRARRRSAFTLIEILVVIGIIGVLLSILLPSISRARRSAQSVACLSNLKQLGLATAMYLNEQKNYLPYPTTTQGEDALWFNALDPYLQRVDGGPNGRTGVAGGRNYKDYKQCWVYGGFEGGRFQGAQDDIKEFARTYKMNSHLRRNKPYRQARVTDVPEQTRFVYLGDATSLDDTGPVGGQWESGQFSFEVNDKTQAGPSLRHNNGANILFVDLHAENVQLTTIKKNLRSPQDKIVVKSWLSEFVNGSGTPADLPDHFKSAEEQGLQRHPLMPLYWSYPPKLYR